MPKLTKMEKTVIDGKCPAMQMFNVFGIEDKPCCYKYMDYCYKIKNCEFKKLVNQIKKLKSNKERN